MNKYINNYDILIKAIYLSKLYLFKVINSKRYKRISIKKELKKILFFFKNNV